MISVIPSCIQWSINTWRANKKGRFQAPVRFEVFNYLVGESCAHVQNHIGRYGIPSQTLSLFFELWPDKKGVGLRYTFWVPASQAAMADDILRQHAGAYTVDSPRLGSGSTYGEPWGVPAKARSWDEKVTQVLFSWIYGRSSVRIKAEKTKGDGTLQKMSTADKTKPAKGASKPRNRKSARKPVAKRIINTIWNA